MMVNVAKTDLDGVVVITPRRFEDSRGYFSETYNARALAGAGIETQFVQDNQSLSIEAGTVRGLHFQAPPFAQSKLVRVLAGAIIDVAVDARKKSATYGRWTAATLSADNGAQLFVPQGFLHGFITLEPNTIVAYKVDNFYDSNADGAVIWNDPDLGIDWGALAGEAKLSDKDANAQSWREFNSPF